MSTSAHNPDGNLLERAAADLTRRFQVLAAQCRRRIANKKKPLKRTQPQRNRDKAARRARRRKG